MLALVRTAVVVDGNAGFRFFHPATTCSGAVVSLQSVFARPCSMFSEVSPISPTSMLFE